MMGKYPFRDRQRSFERFKLQGDLLRRIGMEFLLAAGIKPGMCVIDVGCGSGEFSRLAAAIVGPKGRVIGIDRDDATILFARQISDCVDYVNVEFEVADLLEYRPPHEPDAYIGRFILSYIDDPDQAVKIMAERTSKGGLIAFQEWDLTSLPIVYPSVPAFDELNRHIIGILRESGVRLDMGTRLAKTMHLFGEETLSRMDTIIERAATGRILRYLEETVRNLYDEWPRTDKAGEVVKSAIKDLLANTEGPDVLLTLAPIIGTAIRVSSKTTNCQIG